MYTLKIKNFQSIKEQTLTFAGFTVICGKSDLGKSALRRATETILFNDWQKSYARVNTTSTKIEFTKDPDLRISCVKSKSDNSFTINDKHIAKINKEAPTLPLAFRQDLNISTQLEPMFMVAYKDTENTKILNSMFGIDRLEAAQYLCGLDFKRAKQELAHTQESLDTKSKELEAQQQKVAKLKALVETLSSIDAKMNAVSELSRVTQALNAEYETLAPIKDQLTTFDSLIFRLSALYERLETTQAYKTARVAYNKAKKQLDALPRVPSTQPLESLLSLSRYMAIETDIETTRNNKIRHISLDCLDKLRVLAQFVYVANTDSIKERLESTATARADIEAQLTKMVCPHCGSPLSSTQASHKKA